MKLKSEYVFNADLEKTIDICVTKTIGNVDYFKETMANVSSVKLIERKDLPDGKIHVKMEFCAHGQIPKALQHILRPEMLTWREISTWDPATRRYNFEVKTRYFTNMFTSKGYWEYISRGPNKTAQVCNGILEVNYPALTGEASNTKDGKGSFIWHSSPPSRARYSAPSFINSESLKSALRRRHNKKESNPRMFQAGSRNRPENKF